MNGMSDLRLDWCSHEAAKYSVKNWHYSESLPAAPVKIGVWENDEFIGSVLYSRGASANIAEPYGMDQTEVCELTRIALDDHDSPVSQIISISLKLLKKNSPGMRLVVSYADPRQEHDGTVYQASNWIYEGKKKPERYISIGGDVKHRKTLHSKYGTSSVSKLDSMLHSNVHAVKVEGKHKYLYPLDDDIRPKIEALGRPYP